MTNDAAASAEKVALDLINKQLASLIVLQKAALMGPDQIFRFVHEDEEVLMHFPYISFESLQQKILSYANFYEAALLRKVKDIVKGAVTIDVGANIGNHTIYFSKIAGAASVDSFEPQRLLFKILTKNIEINDLKGVTAHNLAVGARKGTVGMNASRSIAMGTSSFHEEGSYPMVSLNECEIAADFVKIDVEGFHVEVLTGAMDYLTRNNPMVWIELREKTSEFESGNALLQKAGYNYKPLDRNNFLYRKAR